MATFDDLFGNKGGKKFIKFEEVGETLLFVQTGEPKRAPQKNNKTGKNVWLVKFASEAKYKPMDEGDFDEDDPTVENAFQPQGQLVIPVQVAGRKKKDGTPDGDFEPFEADWEVTKDQEPKLKDSMLETGLPASPGTRYAVKLLSRAEKPYKYAVKTLPAE